MKKKAAAILITAMALNLVACSSSNTSNTTTAGQDTAAAENADTTEAAEEGDSEATEGEGLKIAFFMYENSNTFTTYIRLGLENYGAEHNVTVESFDGRSDQATQTDGITAALATPLFAGPQPHKTEVSWFGLFPFRSPLLRESQLITFPLGT